MVALLGFLVGPAGKLVGILAGLVGAGLFVLWAMGQHDTATRAQRDLAQAQANVSSLQAQAVAADAKVREVTTATQRRLDATTLTHRSIAHAPVTTACAAAPAIGVALDGLRQLSATDANGGPPGSGKPTRLHVAAPRS